MLLVYFVCLSCMRYFLSFSLPLSVGGWLQLVVVASKMLEQSDQGLHFLSFCLHLLDALIYLKPHCSNFRIITAILFNVRVITAIFRVSEVVFFRILPAIVRSIPDAVGSMVRCFITVSLRMANSRAVPIRIKPRTSMA